MTTFRLNKDEQLLEANALVSLASSKGYKTEINVSDLKFGTSTYVYVSINNVEFKVRFSDHSVNSLDRIFGEIHSNNASEALRCVELEYDDFKKRKEKSDAEESILESIRESIVIPEGYEVFSLRAYKTLEEFKVWKPTAIEIVRVDNGSKSAYFEYLDLANGYGDKSFTRIYLKNKI